MTDELANDISRMLGRLFAHRRRVPLGDIIREADLMTFPEPVASLFRGLPNADYTRQRLVDQVNSAIVGRGLSRSLGTLE
jgi:hypothetical protein